MFWFWVIFIATVSVVWALYSIKKEREKKELDHAKDEMIKGRVIFHSSSADESDSSL
jgi:hypothetical protein